MNVDFERTLRTLPFLTVCLALLSACADPSGRRIEVLDPPLIKADAEPVQMELELTIIPMSTYTDDPLRVDSINTDGPFSYQIDNSNIQLFGRPKKPLYVLNLWQNGVAESILLKRTKPKLHNFLYIGDANGVKVIGDFNNWKPNLILDKNKNGGAFSDYLLLRPGKYEYRLLVDGKEMLDPYNKDSVNRDGQWNSLLEIAGADIRKSPVLAISSFSKDRILISLEKANGFYVFWENMLLTSDFVTQTEKGIEVQVPSNAREMDRSTLQFWAENMDNSAMLEIDVVFGEVALEAN
ncbi:MAG: glycogen-binding domain-containing protein [Cyclobacteriaceae bacterium]